MADQRLSITGDADVKFYFVVFVICTLLATGLNSTGAVSNCVADTVAVSIGGNYCEWRTPTTTRNFPASGTSSWYLKDTHKQERDMISGHRRCDHDEI